ncbi:MAG TPA: GGDEF domain-containing protein [Pseudonocardiaceae bacterium]|nr:GGDEF domain-containing protein [Pseudonocardiaceae bacterium]
MWTERAPVVGYVLAVELTAVALVLGMTAAMPVRPGDLVRFGLLALGAMVHQEAVRTIEKLRERAIGSGLFTNLKSLWIFAAVLSVPPSLVFGVTAVVYGHAWYRTSSTSLYRMLFSAATMVLATAAAIAVLRLSHPQHYPIIPHGLSGLVLLIAAGLVFWLVNYALVIGAVILSDPHQPARRALGSPSDQVVIAAALGLGIALTVMLAWEPWLIAVLMITVIALHKSLLLPHFQQAARTDSKTGLCTPGFWHEVATKELERAHRLAQPLSLLILDLDHFKSFNDRWGHLVGDQLLRAVADELRQETRPYDLVGRFGGEEFVMLLPGVGPDQVEKVADRIRQRIKMLSIPVGGLNGQPVVVTGLSVSIGAAVSPENGAEIDQLLLAADSALMAAKEAGRDQVRLAG